MRTRSTNNGSVLEELEPSSQLRTIHKEKEVKTMKYEKPEVVVLASATDVIQSSMKGSSSKPDATAFTIGAYEADE
jgi:hypothetical protein